MQVFKNFSLRSDCNRRATRDDRTVLTILCHPVLVALPLFQERRADFAFEL